MLQSGSTFGSVLVFSYKRGTEDYTRLFNEIEDVSAK